jgi:CRISPR/Cas system-associated protein endoribonuclease Cas2
MGTARIKKSIIESVYALTTLLISKQFNKNKMLIVQMKFNASVVNSDLNIISFEGLLVVFQPVGLM